MPRELYRTVVADPPWRVKGGSLKGGVGHHFDYRGAPQATRDLPYPTLSLEQIAALPVRDLVADDAHLYLWTINKYVENAYGIARAWGFKPSTMLVWAKKPIGAGLGGAWGIATEYVLYARRGQPETTGKVGRNWWDWKRPYDERGKPKHSAKPPAFLDLVEQVSPGPYLELFARSNRMGWDTWGDEAFEHVEIESP